MTYFHLLTNITFRCDENDFRTESNDYETTIIISKGSLLIRNHSSAGIGRSFIEVENVTFKEEDIIASWNQK